MTNGTLYIFLYIGVGVNHFGTVNLDTGAVTLLATNNPQSEFEGAIQRAGVHPDVPWLSTDPSEGTVYPDGGFQVVEVTFATTELVELGDYLATLRIKTNDPLNPSLDIPVTLHVVTQTFGVDVSPDMEMWGSPGDKMIMPVYITNTGNFRDTFTFKLLRAE
jgi:hypothetical protein